MSAIKNKYDFLLYFDVTNGNINGDPDAGNMPRLDAETGLGLATDVCIKRKIRNYASLAKDGEAGYALYVTPEHTLNVADLDALVAAGVVPNDTTLKNLDSVLKGLKKSGNVNDVAQLAREAACSMYFDVRTFGAVMTGFTSVGASQIRGPVQISFGRTVEPVVVQEVAITRQAFTTEAERENKDGTGTMGRKYVIPYGLFVVKGHVSAALAQKYDRMTGAGFSEEDLALLWQSLMGMFEHDYSSNRGDVVAQRLVIFKHESKMGNARVHKLFDRVHVQRKPGVAVARSFADYDFEVDTSNMPVGVTCEVLDE